MAGEGSDDLEPKEGVSPLPPRREPPLIEAKAEPQQTSEAAGLVSPFGTPAGSHEAVDDEPARAPVQNDAPPPRKKSGSAALPLSILFGALIAVGGAFGLHYYDTSSSAVGQFASRLDALTEKTDSLSGLSGKVDSLSTANTALADKVEALDAEAHKPAEPASAQSDGPDQAVADLEKRLATLEASVAALPKPADTAANPAPDAGLQKKVAELEDAIGSSQKANASLQAEVQKIADAQKAVAERPTGNLPASNVAPIDARLSKIEGKIPAIETSLAEEKTAIRAVQDKQAAPAPVVNLAPLDSRLSKLEAQLPSIESSLAEEKTAIRAVQDKQAAPAPVVNLAPLDSRISKLEAELPPMEASLAEAKTDIHAAQDKLAVPPPGQDQNAAIVAITLLQRVQQGLPFETELAALGNLNIDPAKLNVLKASAAKGVASVRSLSEDFRQLAPSLIKESEKSVPGQSFFDRLAGDAAHLVRIERIGDQRSTDVPSLINRIETALDQNDVDAAYALWEQFPAPEKAISAAFGDAMKARLETVSASWSIASDAVANLSKQKS